MKTIQEIARETRESLRRLISGQVTQTECAETLWELRGYLHRDVERDCLDSILADLSRVFGSIDKIGDYFEPTEERNLNELWKWFISDQSHVRLVEAAIRNYEKTDDLYRSISLALCDKKYEIFEVAKAYIMEIYEDQPDEDEDEDK